MQRTNVQSDNVRSVKGGGSAAMGGAGGAVRLRVVECIHGSEVEARNFTAVNARNGVQTRRGARAAIAATTYRKEERTEIGGQSGAKYAHSARYMVKLRQN